MVEKGKANPLLSSNKNGKEAKEGKRRRKRNEKIRFLPPPSLSLLYALGVPEAVYESRHSVSRLCAAVATCESHRDQ